MTTGMCGTYGKNRNNCRVSVRSPKEGELLEDIELIIIIIIIFINCSWVVTRWQWLFYM